MRASLRRQQRIKSGRSIHAPRSSHTAYEWILDGEVVFVRSSTSMFRLWYYCKYFGQICYWFLFNKTNRRNNFPNLFLSRKYTFRAALLPIIRSFPLYIRHWYIYRGLMISQYPRLCVFAYKYFIFYLGGLPAHPQNPHSRRTKIRIEVIRKELKIPGIQDVRFKYKQNWSNHLERMDITRFPKHVLKYKPRGRRDRGRPRKRWQRVDGGTGQAT